MKETTGDIWKANTNYICVTTNPIINSKGEVVMGRGIALQCKTKYPEFPKLLAEHIRKNGNVPFIDEKRKIVTFPTKHHWHNKSDLLLIICSAKRINKIMPKDCTIAIPRVGCGNGKLNWNEVKPQIEQILDDRFIVYNGEQNENV